MQKYGEFLIEHTEKVVNVYTLNTHRLVGSAGVQNKEDFDLDVLVKFALRCNGENITGKGM